MRAMTMSLWLGVASMASLVSNPPANAAAMAPPCRVVTSISCREMPMGSCVFTCTVRTTLIHCTSATQKIFCQGFDFGFPVLPFSEFDSQEVAGDPDGIVTKITTFDSVQLPESWFNWFVDVGANGDGDAANDGTTTG